MKIVTRSVSCGSSRAASKSLNYFNYRVQELMLAPQWSSCLLIQELMLEPQWSSCLLVQELMLELEWSSCLK